MRLGRLRMAWVTGGLLLVAAASVIANPKYHTHTDHAEASNPDPRARTMTMDEYLSKTPRKQMQQMYPDKSDSNPTMNPTNSRRSIDDYFSRASGPSDGHVTPAPTPDPAPTNPKARSGRVPQKYCDPRKGGEATCGNGVCESGETPYDCFEDCFSYAQRTPASECPSSPNLQLTQANITEAAINSKYLWRLPGADFVASGLDLKTGEPTLSPLFQFTYCGGEGHTLASPERGIVYGLPDQVDAAPYPKCDFSVHTESYRTSVDMAKTKADKTNIERSVTAGYDDGAGTSASATTTYAYEKSVRRGHSVTTDKTCFLTESKAQCFVSRVALNRQQINFNVEYLAALASAKDTKGNKVDATNRLAQVVRDYGFLYYAEAVLGGEVSLVSSHDTSKLSTHDTEELKRSHSISYSSKVSAYGFTGEQSTKYANERTDTSSIQKNYESATFHSSILARGGAPGSFGPAMSPDSDEAPMTWGAWAQTVDANPWPIEYTADLTENLFEDDWAFSTAGCPYNVPSGKKCTVKSAWREAVKKFLVQTPPIKNYRPTVGRYWFELSYASPRSTTSFVALLMSPNGMSGKLSGEHTLKVQNGGNNAWTDLPNTNQKAPGYWDVTFDWNSTLVSEDEMHGIVLADRELSQVVTGMVKGWSLYSPDAHLSWQKTHPEHAFWGFRDLRLIDAPETQCPAQEIVVDLWMCIITDVPWHWQSGYFGVSFSVRIDTNQGPITVELRDPKVLKCNQGLVKDDPHQLIRYHERNAPSFSQGHPYTGDPASLKVKSVHVHPWWNGRGRDDSAEGYVHDWTFKVTRAAVRLPCGDRGSPVRNTARPTVFGTNDIRMTLNHDDPSGVINIAPHPDTFLQEYVQPEQPLHTFQKPPPVPLRCTESEEPSGEN